MKTKTPLSADDVLAIRDETGKTISKYAAIFGVTNLAVVVAAFWFFYSQLSSWKATASIDAKNEAKQEAVQYAQDGIDGFLTKYKTQAEVIEKSVEETQSKVTDAFGKASELIGSLGNAERDAVLAQERYSNLEDSLTILSDSNAIKSASEFVKKYEESSIREFEESFGKRLATVEDGLAKITNSKPEWPHAINCGSDWSTMLIQHAVPNEPNLNAELISWYAQVYQPNYRFVQFKADMTYHGKGGDSPATTAGCIGKSIAQLREEGRTFYFFAD